MNTREIADRLTQLCRKGDWKAAQDELFSKDAVSIEPQESPGFAKETKGLDAIRAKGEKWETMVDEVHGVKVSEPQVAGNAFSVVMDMDMTMKDRGRQSMSELCVYETKDGKITSERFYM